MTQYLRGSFSVGPSAGVDQETVEANWERTFGKKKEELVVPDPQEPPLARVLSVTPVLPGEERSLLLGEINHLKELLRAVTSDKSDSTFTDEQNYWRHRAVEAIERAGWVSPTEVANFKERVRGKQLIEDGSIDAEDVENLLMNLGRKP